MASSTAPAQVPADTARVTRLIRALAITASTLSVFTAGLYFAWGAGPALPELNWFHPFVLTFQALASMAVSYVAFGRYRALGDPASYWVGVAFCVYGTGLVEYVLVWPGLLPEGGALLGHLPGTAAWLTVLATMGLWAFLTVAARRQRIGATRVPVRAWSLTTALTVALTIAAGALIIGFESRLPSLVGADGSFTVPLVTIYAIEIALLAAGAWTTARQARRSGDPLLALTAFLPLVLAFILLWVLIGTGRYSLWWYLGRIALTGGALTVLFGTLAEHVTLLGRERARTRDLEAAENRLLANYQRLQEANRELEQEDRRKNEFLAVLSHELRNPLATIFSVLQVMERADRVPDAELESLHGAALRQATHMTRLLDDLLDVARISRGTINLRRQELDLGPLVEAAIEALRPRLVDKRHELNLALAPAVTVRGDALRLTQVVSNLVDNATKYTPEGGNIDIVLEREDRQVLIRVRDNGIGIAPDRLDDIFELFVQADPSLDRSTTGLGVGLTLTRTLVEMHGGSVEVHSDGRGHGSEFIVRLPVGVRSGSEDSQPDPADVARARRVLLVEDDADAARSLATLLGALGHVVQTAASGEAALGAASEFQPEVVLLDIGLPGMDGCEAARRLRASPESSGATLVALTGYGREEDRRRIHWAGFDHYLVKPVGLEALNTILSALARPQGA